MQMHTNPYDKWRDSYYSDIGLPRAFCAIKVENLKVEEALEHIYYCLVQIQFAPSDAVQPDYNLALLRSARETVIRIKKELRKCP